jgi:hypothetical protein
MRRTDSTLFNTLETTMPTVNDLQARIAELESELDRANRKMIILTGERDDARQAERRAQIGRQVAEVARQAGALPESLVDIEHRALLGDWRPDAAGNLRLHENGVAAINDGGEPVTLKVWAADLKQSAKYFFEPVDGTPLGQAGRQNKAQTNEPNPFDHRSPAFNVTEQGRIVRANREKAAAMAAAAGWDEDKIRQIRRDPTAA